MSDFQVLKPRIYCHGCGVEQSITRFRVLSEAPLTYVDFCMDCEKVKGTKTLYTSKQTAGYTTKRAADFILNGHDAQAEKIEKKAVSMAEEQRRELARRELSRRYLLYYTVQFNPTYLAGWVHKDIARRLEQFVRDVEAKKSPRLMIFMPPRHGKSTLASQELPSWVLGGHPTWEIISASYAVSLPLGFSRKIKDRLEDPSYSAIFPEAQLRPDAKGVEEWLTTKGGRYRAAGVEGGITGTGADILIIDDPIKDYQEAQSETVRENAYNWFTTTARSRLAPGGGVLIIQTRWHDADLSGRLLTDRQSLIDMGVDQEEIDDWQVVSYPAIAEHDEYLFPDKTIQIAPAEVPENATKLRSAGDALHPERYTAKALRTMRNTMPPVQWNALYQQNPVPDTGEFFNRDMFRPYVNLPGMLDEYAFFLACDLAIGEKQTNDWTVAVVGALNNDGDLYLMDFLRGRMGTYQIIDALLTMAQKYEHLQVMGLEYGQIYKTMAPLLKDAMQHRKVTFALTEDLKPVTDKLMRARPLQQKMQMGKVYFPANRPWVSQIEQEMLRFPSGQHDDIVDAMAWLARMALTITPPQPPKMITGRRVESWKKQLNVLRGDGKSFMTA